MVFQAEEEGFEPPEPLGSTVFKTAAIDHSATPLYWSIMPNETFSRITECKGTCYL